MPEIELVTLEPQPVAVIHAVVRLDEIPALFDRAFPQIMATLAAQGMEPAGVPFARYFGAPTDTVELDVGIPVPAPIEPAGEVAPAELPGGVVARTVHVGPYDAMVATYEAMAAFLVEQGLTPGGEMWEVYLTNPAEEPDPATWRTEVFWPAA